VAKPFWSATPAQMNAGQWALLLALCLGIIYVVPRALDAVTPSTKG